MYTIQSNYNGKYISSLFSNNHISTFTAQSLELAYKWANFNSCQLIADTINGEYPMLDIDLCKVVEIP